MAMKPAIALLALGCFASALPACVLACDAVGCGGGFSWSARAEDGSALPPGIYAVSITLEGNRYTSTCAITEHYGESECSELSRVEGDVDFSVMLQLELQDGEQSWDSQKPVSGFFVDAIDRTESEDSDNFSANRGPTSVSILIELDGTAVIDESYELSYDRNDKFRGDVECGYCDSLEERSAIWDPADVGVGF
jgi:hypothetical protein